MFGSMLHCRRQLSWGLGTAGISSPRTYRSHARSPVLILSENGRKDARDNPGYRRGGDNAKNERASGNGNGRGGEREQRSRKGRSYEQKNRRRGRPAHLRSPDDTPLRDGNRDRLLGLLTDRAARTLLHYLLETNLTLHSWLYMYLKQNEIPKNGNWDDVSGETFLRKLLASPMEQVKYDFNGRDEMFSCAGAIGVDPRNIAQRIMEIRSQIAKEWIEELKEVSEENALLMRETVLSSFSLENIPVADPKGAKSTHPEMQGYQSPDDSAGGSDD